MSNRSNFRKISKNWNSVKFLESMNILKNLGEIKFLKSRGKSKNRIFKRWLKNLEKIELSKNPKKLNLEGPVNQAITTKNSFYEITASDQLQRASHFSHGFQQKNRVAAPI